MNACTSASFWQSPLERDLTRRPRSRSKRSARLTCQVAGRGPDDETAALIMTLLLFYAVTIYGAMVLSGVVEEESSRVVEVPLARMPARNLLAGKVTGIGLLGLAQIAITALVAVAAINIGGSLDVPAGSRHCDRLGRRVVRARLRPLRHRVRRPRLARLACRGYAKCGRSRHRCADRRLLVSFATMGSTATSWSSVQCRPTGAWS